MKPDLRWTAVMVCALAAITAASASAQEYPQRPIRMIVGLPAGGSTDLMGRLLAAKLGERFGQQVVFDNRHVVEAVVQPTIANPFGQCLVPIRTGDVGLAGQEAVVFAGAIG